MWSAGVLTDDHRCNRLAFGAILGIQAPYAQKNSTIVARWLPRRPKADSNLRYVRADIGCFARRSRACTLKSEFRAAQAKAALLVMVFPHMGMPALRFFRELVGSPQLRSEFLGRW